MDKGINTSELWVLIVGMACPLITAYTGIPIEPALVVSGLSAVWVICRTALKIVKTIKEKKQKVEIVPSVFPVIPTTGGNG